MLKSHEKFHSANGKRKILVVDDEYVNRALLGEILKESYEVVFASDGIQALERIGEHGGTLSLVLLDLMMPVMSGIELMKKLKENEETRQIPVIVMTSEQEAEVESLTLGASDFIPKPYPQPEVILARILRSIELSEDREIINSTERDPLTGLYNKEYFYRYAEQFDQHHKALEMDAIVVDVNHFHMINERFGTAYGDEVLHRIGERVRDMVRDTGGIVCRREADTFLVYCPHGKDYRAILDNASIGLAGDATANNRVRLRMGIYENVDKSLDIERRFDRAKLAADTVRNSFTRTIGIYDGALHEKELYAEQLIEDFHQAIAERQFKVYYQPKFDVRPDIPVLASAEALVRWQHPTLGLISPGMFIPLFEDNGLIQELDNYVWREAARQIREWRERFDITVPVSVNMSRIDMYDPHLTEILQKILSDNGLSTHELLLEITESAYTQDSEQIIEVVNRLRRLGFQIEMDDFGTGYSSLNMISKLPIDALKLDMQFIHNAFSQGRDTRMLEVIVDIADYLSVPVIAEGVETEEQLNALKAMGCDLVQGYYFSRPVPAAEYERFVKERKDQGEPDQAQVASFVRAKLEKRDKAFVKITHALSSGYESIYYVDVENHRYVEFSSDGEYENLQIEHSGADFFEETQQNIGKIVYDADRSRVSLCMQKEALLAQLNGSLPFSMTYRLVINGAPVYYNLKAVRAHTHDDHHIVIGVSNVDSLMRQASGQGDGANELSFTALAKALTSDVESIIYVDTTTDTYTVFSKRPLRERSGFDLNGDDFFDKCRENIGRSVYVDDRDRLYAAMKKEKLLSVLEAYAALSVVYRLMIDGRPVYYRLKAVKAEGQDNRHIIIGISNIDLQISDEEKRDVANRSTITFTRIAQALSQDYISIYYVDTETDHFIEYSSYGKYQNLGIEKSGDDFFGTSRKNAGLVVYPEDLNMFLLTFTKEKVMRELGLNRTFTLTYRLIFDGVPTFVHLKATRMADQNDKHIVIGISNVDDQIKRENEYAEAIRMANRDALTGVKSKHAYVEMEQKFNRLIDDDDIDEFAVVVCDINGLKTINDTLGHQAGDRYIKDACALVCNVFKHSPVYRIGGDEFAVILRGDDYRDRAELSVVMERKNAESELHGGVIVASGMSEYRRGEDTSLTPVFARADAAMYANKSRLKEM